ncbi:MAG: GMC family oxidoreductase [Peptococcaceae bacterium]|nr:GMC family oxidoreductase [Peptococcaceae bacterium]
MRVHYDAVVVGSGFGGAVAACRLVQAGMRVCILERGRWWSPQEFPLHNDDPRAWLWTGWSTGLYQYHYFEDMDVVVASGVGGGSLVYANVLIVPPADVFATGWPAAITLSVLAPYYQRVREMLHPMPYPRAWSRTKTRVMYQAAELTGRRENFKLPDLGVYWGQPGVPHPDPYGFGTSQTGCADLAECVTGCPIRAKNSLDLNYIALALRNGAECRPLHEVVTIAREGNEFTVYYLDRSRPVPEEGKVCASRVVLAAGTLGSTEILLKAVYKYRTLGPVSPALGRGFSGNGDIQATLIGIAPEVSFTTGPTITASINYPEEHFLIEDGGLPPVVTLKLNGWLPSFNALPLLMMGRDAADGLLRLTGRRQKLTLEWSYTNSLPLFKAMERCVQELAAALGGQAVFMPAWSLARKLITVHPLGGCRMADSPQYGVVDDGGAVYGQPGLYVADGSIVPTSLGVNPALTIAALAERVAERIIREG